MSQISLVIEQKPNLALPERTRSFILAPMEDLRIVDTVEGSGIAAVKGALLFCHYEGFLEDGTKFDSSYDHGRPFQFVIGSGRVIKGWDQGLMGMKEGGKRTLYVPAHLGYGEREKGKIKPHSNLIFHVELLEVRPRES